MKNLKFATVFLVMLISLAVGVLADPTLPTINDQSISEDTLLQFSITLATGPDNGTTIFTICDALTQTGTCTGNVPDSNGVSSFNLGLVTPTPANLTYASDTEALFMWKPSATAEGTYFVQFDAADTNSSATTVVKITVNDVAPTLVVGSLVLGDKNQVRSNPRHDDEEDREVNVTGIFTITNTGIEQLTGLTATTVLGSEAGKTSVDLNDLKTEVSFPDTVLDAGESMTVTVIMRVPEELDAVDKDGKKKAFNVANIDFIATRTQAGHQTETVSAKSTVTLEAENNLKMTDGKIRFNGDSERIDDDDNVKDVKPGDDVTIEIEVENKFKDKEDVDIEDIELLVENDDDLDVDEDQDGDDLGPEDEDTISVEFDIDEDVSKGDEDLIITVIGEDENGALHGERWIVTLEIEREDHEIDIRSLFLQPESVTCGTETQLTVEVRNTGRRDEDDVFIRVASPDLNFGKISDRLQLDEDDESTRNFIIPVPRTLNNGNYRITVETFYRTGTRSITDGILVTKQTCAADVPDEDEPEPEEPSSQDDIIVVTQPPVVMQPPVVGTPDAVTPPTGAVVADQDDFLSSNLYIGLLILAYVAVLGIGAVIAVKLLRK